MNVILLSSTFADSFERVSTMKPLSCYQLASWLRQHGYSVKVIDHCGQIDPQILLKIIEKYSDSTTIAIGVSSTFWLAPKNREIERSYSEPDWVSVVRGSKKISELDSVDWLLGGPIASRSTDLEWSWKLFLGAGEDSLLSYLDNKTGRGNSRSLFDITTSNMEYHESDFIQSTEALSLELGRGCQFKCKFCRYPNIGKTKGTYLRSIDCVKNNLIHNYEKFGITKYNMVDDTFNEDYDKVVAFANMVQTLPFELNWVGYNRADLIYSKPDTIQILKDSGLKSAFFGIESFNPQASKLVNKGWFGKRAKDFLLELRDEWKNDVTFFMSFITGFDTEPPDEVADTVDWLLDNHFYSWVFQPLNIRRLPPNNNSPYVSEFDLHHENYGYKFPNASDSEYWESVHWNKNDAGKMARECNARLGSAAVPAGFGVFEYTNLGYDLRDVLTMPLSMYDIDEIKNKKTQFFNNYIESSMNFKL
jgi:hypothetical protein